MPLVNVMIGRRQYELMCGEGQEGHLRNLAEQLHEKCGDMAQQVPGASDSLLMAMTALMLQDELNDIEKKDGAANKNKSGKNADDEVADAMNAIADYVEKLTADIGLR